MQCKSVLYDEVMCSVIHEACSCINVTASRTAAAGPSIKYVYMERPKTSRPVNPIMGTLNPQSNGHSNTMIGTVAVDGWAVTFGSARRGLGGLRPRPVPSSLRLAVPNVTAHPSTASVPTSYYSI